MSSAKLHDKLKKCRHERLDPEIVTEFLERSKSLYLSYISATSEERREIVKCTTSNRRVVGRNVELEPQNWLSTLRTGEASLVARIIRSQIEPVPEKKLYGI